MFLGGRYLIILRGPPGSRRKEIAHLIAGGVAYLSTLTDFSGTPGTAEEIAAGGSARPTRHVPVAVFSTADCYWNSERDAQGRAHKVWEYNADTLQVARDDVLRRVRLGMLEGLSFIIVDDPHLEKTEVTQFLNLARSYSYEIIPIDIPDHRYEVLLQRHTQGKEHFPPNILEPLIKGFLGWPSWALEHKDGGTFVNPEAPESAPTIEPATLEAQPAVVPEVLPIMLMVKDFESSIQSAWIFLAEMGVKKLSEQRKITSELIAQRDVRGARDYPVLTVTGVELPLIMRRARDLGVSVEVIKETGA